MSPIRNVNRVKPQSEGRSFGLRILKASAAVAVFGIGPLLLYMLLGPADGNPIGLGLLAMVSVPVAGCGALIGAVTLAVEFFGRARD